MLDTKVHLALACQLEYAAKSIRTLCAVIDAKVIPAVTEAVSPDQSKIFLMPLSDLDLSSRVKNCLEFREPKITNIGELVSYDAGQLCERRNFGTGCLREVREQLAKHGLKLRYD